MLVLWARCRARAQVARSAGSAPKKQALIIRLTLRVDFHPRRMGVDDESNQVTEGHLVDALAHTGDEGRGTLR